MEEPTSDGNTIFDFVEVFDGPDASSPLLVKLSGNQLPDPIVSTGPNLFLRFTSDLSEVRGGWSASYSTQTTVFCDSQTELTSLNGSFNDGSGETGYGNNSSCKWLIQPENVESITLSFDSFNTEQDYDGVIVYDGADTSSEVLGVFTGSSLPHSVTSTGESMLVWFLTDEDTRFSGWEARYESEIVTSIAGIKENIISVYPNPTKRFVKIDLNEFPKQEIEIELINAVGQTVLRRIIIYDKETSLDLVGLVPAIYFLQVMAGESSFIERVHVE